MANKTKRLAVDIDPKLHAKFTKAVREIGSKKGYALTKMIEDFVLQSESYPTGHPFFTNWRGKAKKNVRSKQSGSGVERVEN